MLTGLFQSLGATAMKDRSPMVTFVKRLGCSEEFHLFLFPRKWYWDGGKTEIKSIRYLGAKRWSTLKVIRRILNSIRTCRLIGNRWNCWRSASSVMWQLCSGVQKINHTLALYSWHIRVFTFDGQDLQDAATFGPREIMQFEVIFMSCLVESLWAEGKKCAVCFSSHLWGRKIADSTYFKCLLIYLGGYLLWPI